MCSPAKKHGVLTIEVLRCLTLGLPHYWWIHMFLDHLSILLPSSVKSGLDKRCLRFLSLSNSMALWYNSDNSKLLGLRDVSSKRIYGSFTGSSRLWRMTPPHISARQKLENIIQIILHSTKLRKEGWAVYIEITWGMRLHEARKALGSAYSPQGELLFLTILEIQPRQLLMLK